MRMETLKVGELAKRTGLTIRTLHHYDEIGLLRPSLHTESGHRLYTANDVVRLQQIVSLRQLGFSLEDIRTCLDHPGFSPLEVITLQVTRLRGEIEWQRKLCERLEALAAHLQAVEEVSTDTFLQIIETMTMIENYYTAEQLEALRKRGEAMGPEAMQQAQTAWADLFAQLRLEMDNGTDPADPRAQALGKRRDELIHAFTGGDPGIEQSLTRLWTEQGDKLTAQYGYDPQVMEYLGKIAEAGKKNSS